MLPPKTTPRHRRTTGGGTRGPGRRLRGALLRQLGVAIVTGEYPQGSVLGDEARVAKQMRVSRGAYREALQALISKGLIERRQKVGTTVLPRSRWNLLDPEVLSWFFENQPDLPFIRDLFELRSVIEPAAARLAAERREARDLEAMAKALEGMRIHTLMTERGRKADQDFHAALLAASRNEPLVTLTSCIASAVTWTNRFKQRSPSGMRDSYEDHARVYQAIAAGDARAAGKAMGRLVALALADTRRMLEP